MSTFAHVLLCILSFPFWLLGFIMVFGGIFGTVKYNDVAITDPVLILKVKVLVVFFGLVCAGVATFLVNLQ